MKTTFEINLLRILLLVITTSATAAAQPGTSPATSPARPQGPERWEETIARFEERDRVSPPPKDGILFIGSSSIRGWKLEEFFDDLPVINRGFGGSQIADSLFYADRIVLPYRPRTIVFYAGENDVAAGKSPEQVARDFEQFAETVRAELPDTRIIYIGLKPSPSRWRLIDQFRQTNQLIGDFIAKQDGITFIDVEPHMLGPDGKPRPELYLKDQLHMTRAGYELWTDLVRPHLSSPATQRATAR